MKTLYLLFTLSTFTVTGCSNSQKPQSKKSSWLPEYPEHHIKENPDRLKRDSTVLYTGWYYIADTPNTYMRELEKTDETYYLNPQPIVTVKSFTNIELYESNYNGKMYLGLEIQFDKTGTEAWRLATRKAISKKVAFILDNKLLYVATVNSEITNGVSVINSDKHSRSEFENFRTIIELKIAAENINK
ncbi:MAG: hypothetical protein KA821_20560 [Chitinophagaceae bacterium]|nr:hypothetical protein [Chitinophagaceae bacterium]